MFSKISKAALALAFCVGRVTAASACELHAVSAECADSVKATVASASHEGESGGCENCTCAAEAAATTAAATTATVGGVKIIQASTAGDAVAAVEGAVAKELAKPEARKFGYENGEKVENFKLVHSQSGKEVTLHELAGEKATVVIFWNQNCPWVEGGPHAAGDRVRQLVKDYADKGVSVIGIDAGTDKTEAELREYTAKQPFPILENRDSTIAARFNAQYTPHTFVLDSNLVLQYQGGFDSGARRAEDGNPVPWAQNALDEVLAGSKPTMAVTRGTGCSIKWAPGSRPTT
jgi:peroxiredoxin